MRTSRWAGLLAVLICGLDPVTAQDCRGPSDCSTEMDRASCCANDAVCEWNPGPMCTSGGHVNTPPPPAPMEGQAANECSGPPECPTSGGRDSCCGSSAGCTWTPGPACGESAGNDLAPMEGQAADECSGPPECPTSGGRDSCCGSSAGCTWTPGPACGESAGNHPNQPPPEGQPLIEGGGNCIGPSDCSAEMDRASCCANDAVCNWQQGSPCREGAPQPGSDHGTHGGNDSQQSAAYDCFCGRTPHQPHMGDTCADGSAPLCSSDTNEIGGNAELVRTASITLDMTLDQVGDPDAAFRDNFCSDVATLMHVSGDRINVISITAGSVVVEFEIFPMGPLTLGESVDDALDRLGRAFLEAQKPEIAGFPSLHFDVTATAVASHPEQASCEGTLTLDTSPSSHEINGQLYRRVSIDQATDAYGRPGESVIEVTCAGCQCPGPDYEVPEIEIASENYGLCTDGSTPDTSITSCCEDEDTSCSGPKCSHCCTTCRFGRLNTRLDEWPFAVETRPGESPQQSHNPVCMYAEPEYCPAFGLVLECVLPGNTVVIPGQARYEECIGQPEASSNLRLASFFGMDNWHTNGCPLSIRSAFALDGDGHMYGGSGRVSGFAVEKACSNGDPDWLTTTTTCSDECATAFFQFWASCGSIFSTAGSTILPRTKELFWRYDAAGTSEAERVVTVPVEALYEFFSLCTPDDGTCPAGTARGQTITVESFGTGEEIDAELVGHICLPSEWGQNDLACPFTCLHGHVDPLQDGNCRPCPRGSYQCGIGCTPCPAGFDAHAGSEACIACPFPDRCLGWNGTTVDQNDFLGCDSEAGVREMAFCSSCEFGRFPFRDKCLLCPSFSWTSVAIVVVVMLLFPVVLWKLSAVEDVEGREAQYGHVALMVSVILPHAQFSTWLMGISLKWPTWITGMAKWVGDLAFLDFGNLLTLDCLTQSAAKRKIADFAPAASIFNDDLSSDYDVHLDVDEPGDMEFLKFVLQTVVFFVIAFFFLGDYASGGCFSQDRKNHAANAVGTTFCLMFPVLIKTSFTMLDCTMEQPCAPGSNECTYYLDIAPSTTCYTVPMNGSRWAFWNLKGANKFYMLWAGFVSFVYIVVIPAIYYVLLRRARVSDDGFDSIERHRFGWFIMRYDEDAWWWEFVQLFKKIFMVAVGIFWNNMALCKSVKQCADGSDISGDGIDVMCDDESAPVPLVVDPATGLCVAMLPGDTNPVYRGTESYPASFVTSMVLLSILLLVMLALQLRFAPYRNPPNAPDNLRLSPPDCAEVACTTLELLILFAGYIRFTNPSTTASDIITAVAAILSLFGPPVYALHSRRVHSEWYKMEVISEDEERVKQPNPMQEETTEE